MGWNNLSIPKFNGITVEVCEWISNFIPHFIMGVITYPCWNKSYTSLVKGPPGNLAGSKNCSCKKIHLKTSIVKKAAIVANVFRHVQLYICPQRHSWETKNINIITCSVAKKLSWFIRHLSDGLCIFYSNWWNLSLVRHLGPAIWNVRCVRWF